MATSRPIAVSRASVLTPWAAVVAEPLGHPPELALAWGRFVAALVPAPRHGGLEIIEESAEAAERLCVTDGTLRAEADGTPASSESVHPYIARAFGSPT